MDNNNYYDKMKSQLTTKIRFLVDKPEETIDSTLRALWFKAHGEAKSAEVAEKEPLPELNKDQLKILNYLIKQRVNNIPLAHLTGRQNFMGVELLCDKRALIPRKETELLGRKALELSNIMSCDKREVKVIDTCCGSGNLGLALAYYNPDVKVYASDLSFDAVDLTRENISFLEFNSRVSAEQGDLFEAFENESFFEKTDLIICNPPYISSSKVPKMDQEISGNEPAMAFDGGMIGIRIIQKLIQEAPRFLVNSGWLAFEVGAGQGDFIIQLCNKSENYKQVNWVSDSAGVVRVIYAQKK